MKTILLRQISTLILPLLLSSYAWAVAPTSGPYVTDPQNEYVQDATSDSIDSVNMILCIISGMNINGSGMLNQGPYIALVDINLCQSHKSSGSSDTNAANYMTAIVDATRGSASTDPMIAKVIVWDETRPRAIQKMIRTLKDSVVFGVHTNIPYLIEILNHDDFQKGTMTTRFIENNFADGLSARQEPKDWPPLAFKKMSTSYDKQTRTSTTQSFSPWSSAWRNI